MKCHDVRDLLAFQSTIMDSSLQAHLDQCENCARYRQRQQALDEVLRAELKWQAPTDLTARLLVIAGTPVEQLFIEPAQSVELFAPTWTVPTSDDELLPYQPAQPKRGYLAAAYTITAMVIALSLLVAFQVFSAVTSQVDVSAALTELLSLPDQAMSYLVQVLPQSRYLIDVLLKLHAQLIWLLLVAVLWAALDKWNISFSFQRTRQTS